MILFVTFCVLFWPNIWKWIFSHLPKNQCSSSPISRSNKYSKSRKRRSTFDCVETERIRTFTPIGRTMVEIDKIVGCGCSRSSKYRSKTESHKENDTFRRWNDLNCSIQIRTALPEVPPDEKICMQRKAGWKNR